VRAGLTPESIRWAFTNGPLGEWYPLSMMSHMVDCQLFGLAAKGHHLTNLVLHAAAAVGLFFVLRNMTAERAVPEAAQASGGRVAGHRPAGWSGPSATTLWPSAFVAAVFAVHPQHVESVAWIAERRDMLSGLFFVLTLGAYTGYVRHGRSVVRYLLVALLLTLGLMAKPSLVTVPPLLMLLDYWPLGRFGHAQDLPFGVPALPKQSFWRLAIEKLPLLAIALGVCVLTMATHRHRPDLPTPSLTSRLANAVVSLVDYLAQMFCPVNLAPEYPYPADGFGAWELGGAVLILVAITAAAAIWRRRAPYLIVGWLWFIGMILPVLGIIVISWHARADRYMYLPSIGLSIAVTWGAVRLAGGSVDGRWALGCCAVLAVAALAICASVQTSYWRDDQTLWTHALAVTDHNRRAEIFLADAEREHGQYREAIEHYEHAAQLGPDIHLLNNLGLALTGMRLYDEAEAQYQRAIDFDPTSAVAYDNLAIERARRGKNDDAIKLYRRAIELDPKLVAARLHLGRLLLRLGNVDEAIEELNAALNMARDEASQRRARADLREAQALAAAQAEAQKAVLGKP
jgi:Flp pilus assembly protein TadD